MESGDELERKGKVEGCIQFSSPSQNFGKAKARAKAAISSKARTHLSLLERFFIFFSFFCQ